MANEQNKENEQNCLVELLCLLLLARGYTEEHWKNVLKIIKTAIGKTEKFEAVPVWENFKSDIIHDNN